MIDFIRCSNLARPMVCAGSLFFKDLPPQETNAAAEEGTAAGEYLRYLVEHNLDAPVSTHASNGVPFTHDMGFYTKPIAEMILKQAKRHAICEQRIDWQTQSGIWIRGSYDVSFVGHDGHLYIDDLKYGWGIVDVKENWQLLGYAIGEVIRLNRAFEKIVLRIHQPRPHHEDGTTREWVLTYEQLLEYKARIETRMLQIVQGDHSLVTSPMCKYCPAAAGACTAFNRMFYRSVEASTEFMQDNINNEELSFQLDLISRANEVLKIRQESLKALAVSRMTGGEIIPNYIAESSYGDRSWKKGVGPQTFKLLTGKDITETTMVSPAKAEKLGVPKEFVNQLVERRFLGQRLVRKDGSDVGNKIFGTKEPGT